MDFTTKTSDCCARRRQSDAVPRLILNTRPPEELEHAFGVFRGNAATIVRDLDRYAISADVAGSDGDTQRSLGDRYLIAISRMFESTCSSAS